MVGTQIALLSVYRELMVREVYNGGAIVLFLYILKMQHLLQEF